MDHMGEVRDLDVLLERLKTDVQELDDADRRGAEVVVAQVLKDLRSLSVPSTPSGAADRQQLARKVHQALDSAGKDLDSAAKTMGIVVVAFFIARFAGLPMDTITSG